MYALSPRHSPVCTRTIAHTHVLMHLMPCSFAVWLHYCNKYLEFFDTIFMVLRGRLDQVSFLHVYHHTTIVWAWYLGINLFIEGDSYFGALLNSIIHVFMYSYYAMVSENNREQQTLAKYRNVMTRYMLSFADITVSGSRGKSGESSA